MDKSCNKSVGDGGFHWLQGGGVNPVVRVVRRKGLGDRMLSFP